MCDWENVTGSFSTSFLIPVDQLMGEQEKEGYKFLKQNIPLPYVSALNRFGLRREP